MNNSSIWMLFERSAERSKAIALYGADDATCLRAQEWAIFFATVLLATGLVDHPSHAAIGFNTLRRLEGDRLAK